MKDESYIVGGFDSQQWKAFEEEMARKRAIREKADNTCVQAMCAMSSTISNLCERVARCKEEDRIFHDELMEYIEKSIQLGETMAHIRTAMNDPMPTYGYGCGV